MLNFFGRAAILIASVSWISLPAIAGEPENAETVSAKLNSADLEKRHDGLGDLVVSHEGLVGCIPALVKMAHRDEIKLRVEALEKIGRFGRFARGTGRQLVDLLEHAEVEVRIAAATAILRVEEKSEPAVAALAAALKDKDHLRRKSAADELGWRPRSAKSAIPALLAATGDEKMEVRAAVAEALGKIASPAAADVIAQLQKMLADPEPWVRGHAATALWNLDVPAATLLPTLIKIVAEYKVDPRREITQDIWGHNAAAKLIQKIGPEAEAAVPALIAALDSPQTGERLAAADALAAIGPAAAPAIERLSKSLRDTEGHSFPFAHQAWFVSDQAALALRKIGPAARPVLLAALVDKDERVRSLAAAQLAALPIDDATITALRKLITDDKVPVRASAVFHLGTMGPGAKVAIPQIVPLLNDSGKWVSFPGGGIGTNYRLAQHALEALQNLQATPAEVLPAMIAMVRKDQRMEPIVQDYLREVGPAAKEVVPALEPILKEPVNRMSAALVLARVAPDHPGLLELLEDHFSRTNDIHRFTQAVGDLGPKAQASLPTLKKVLARDAQYPVVRAMVATAIVNIDSNDSDAIAVIAESLQDFHWNAHEIPETHKTWSKLGPKRIVAEAKLLAGLTAVATEPEDDAYFRNVNEKERRLRSALLLNDLGTKQMEVIAACVTLLGCDVCNVRGDAADALGAMGAAADSAAPVLVTLLDDEENYIVNGDFYGNGGVWHYPGDHARDALSKIGVPALPVLQTALKDDSRTIRRRAAEAIGNIGVPAQVAGDDLTRVLQDPHREVRAAAARALGQVGDSQNATIAALSKAAADQHLVVREAAKTALAKMKPNRP